MAILKPPGLPPGTDWFDLVSQAVKVVNLLIGLYALLQRVIPSGRRKPPE